MRATREQLAVIERGRAKGWREKYIYLELGISAPTFIKWKNTDPRVVEAMERGQERLYNSLVGKLIAKAQGGDTISLIYATKALLGLRDNDVPQEARPQVTINLPGALSAQDFARLVSDSTERLALPAALPPVIDEVSRG
jgi:hypothetical protein